MISGQKLISTIICSISGELVVTNTDCASSKVKDTPTTPLLIVSSISLNWLLSSRLKVPFEKDTPTIKPGTGATNIYTSNVVHTVADGGSSTKQLNEDAVPLGSRTSAMQVCVTEGCTTKSNTTIYCKNISSIFVGTTL